MEQEIKKIVIIGPESTGKSTLCEQLAQHYNTLWVREYAREYLEKNGADYRFEDLYEISLGQLAGEELGMGNWQRAIGNRQGTTDDGQALSGIRNLELGIGEGTPNNKELPTLQPSTFNLQPLFIDTDLYVIKVWSEFVFNKTDNRILTEIAKREYDLYLLCDVDLPWVKDELREYPDLAVREKLFHYYKEEMIEQKTPWVIIRGNYEERLAAAIAAVDGLF